MDLYQFISADSMYKSSSPLRSPVYRGKVKETIAAKLLSTAKQCFPATAKPSSDDISMDPVSLISWEPPALSKLLAYAPRESLQFDQLPTGTQSEGM